MKISHLLGASALAGIAIVGSPAFAQTAPTAEQCRTDPALPGCPTQTDGSDQAQGEGDTQSASAGRQGSVDTLTGPGDNASSNEVVVTGSRIRSPNLTSDVPITSLGGEVVFQQSDQNIGEVLNDLPQLRSTFSQQNPAAGIGIAGLNLLDLRGLGPQRTLVLVNGRRHVPADILANAVSPDVSSIPNDLIERVDIVTGGNSAVYGSDAIAGVVNFVLRRQFDGVQLRGSATTNEKGFGGSQFLSAMVGKNFADGRGNVTLHGEYSRQERVFASDVPYFVTARGLFGVDADAGTTLVNGGDGFPDAIFLSDVRSGTIDYRGLVQINQRNLPNGQCGNATLPNDGPTNNAGPAFSCAYIFTADGRLTPQTGSRFGAGINAARIGGNGQTGREGQTVSVLPFLERYNFNLLSHYEFSPAVELFVEAKFNRTDTVGNNAGPSFVQTPNGNQGNVGDFREAIRLDNPFLNQTDRTTLANLILASGCNPSLQVICPAAGNLTATQQAQIAAGTYRFILARNLLDVGLRDEVFRRDTYRAVAGLRGTFNDDWGYEISGNYGRFEQTNTTTGYIDRQRFSLSLDAGRNPATGAIQCRSQFDAASALVLQRTDPVSAGIRAENQARLAADIAACVPYNPFGLPDNSAAVNYFSSTVRTEASLEQIVGQAFLSGDLSQLFELPGGPIRFSVGAEYRREKARYVQNDFAARGFTNAVSIPVFAPPAFEVKEAFGEVQLPLLRDAPFFQELTITGAGRVSDYKGGTGTVYTYNGGVQWAPVRDIRLRGIYARAVRAPNVSETGFPLVPNFTSITDPCNVVQIASGTQFRRANCTALVGAGNLGNLPSVTYSLPIVSGSNPNLNEETSDSYTLGGVIQPRWIPGLAVSADYYDITVNGIISAVGAQTILNNCVDFSTTNNIFCSAFTRFQGPGLGPNGEQPGAVLGNSLIVAPLNFAKRTTRGIDVNVNYRTNIGSDSRFTTNLIYVHTIERSNFEDPTNPNFENRILGEVGDPQDEFRLDMDFGYKAFTFGYRLRFIGPQYLVAYEAVKGGVNGLPPSNIDAAEPNRYPAITYSDIRFEWNVGNSNTGIGDAAKGLRFFAGVDNVLNQLPPLGTLATGGGTAIYDFRGRAYYAGARVRF